MHINNKNEENKEMEIVTEVKKFGETYYLHIPIRYIRELEKLEKGKYLLIEIKQVIK